MATQRGQRSAYEDLTDCTPASDQAKREMDAVRRAYASLARHMERTIPDGPNKSAGMRQLLQAKDSHVRALL